MDRFVLCEYMLNFILKSLLLSGRSLFWGVAFVVDRAILDDGVAQLSRLAEIL